MYDFLAYFIPIYYIINKIVLLPYRIENASFGHSTLKHAPKWPQILERPFRDSELQISRGSIAPGTLSACIALVYRASGFDNYIAFARWGPHQEVDTGANHCSTGVEMFALPVVMGLYCALVSAEAWKSNRVGQFTNLFLATALGSDVAYSTHIWRGFGTGWGGVVCRQSEYCPEVVCAGILLNRNAAYTRLYSETWKTGKLQCGYAPLSSANGCLDDPVEGVTKL